MSRRCFAILFATAVAFSVWVPCASAALHASGAQPTSGSSKELLALASAVQNIRIGLNSTTVTIQNGAKSHPIVIEYGDALKTGSLGFNNDGSTSGIARGNAAVGSPLPKSLSLGTIVAWLLGLTLVSRILSVARQFIPHRIGR